MVKKSNGKWKMCIDYIDLNKACSKDSYPLSSIDRLINGASVFPVLSFLDAYSGHNQIPMLNQDEEKMTFMTDTTYYYYSIRSFGLKNARATYQRLMDKIFKDQLGRNLEVYMDDIVVKSASTITHAKDLEEIFAKIQKHNMRLNLEKCVFGVQGGKLLGFMITSRGIQPNLEKFMTIIEMRSPNNLKEV